MPLYGLRKLQGLLDPQLRAIHGGDEEGDDENLSLELANDEPFSR